MDLKRRYSEREAAQLIARGYEFVDVTQLVDAERMFMISRVPAQADLLAEVRALCQGR